MQVEDRVARALKSQVSLAHRVNHERHEAERLALASGLSTNERKLFADKSVADYMKNELVRKAVKDVIRRGGELDKKRKAREQSYAHVKSKVA